MTMPTLARLTCAAAIMMICGQAHAADKRMPIDFIGEWCNPTPFDGKTNYTLPSWSEDHITTTTSASPIKGAPTGAGYAAIAYGCRRLGYPLALAYHLGRSASLWRSWR
jgi:hypothetical protein